MAQLELSVVLNLANFRTQLGKLAQASAAYYYPINLTIDQKAFKKQLAVLGNIKTTLKIDDSQLDAARARVSTLNKSLATLRRATSTPIEIKLKYVEVGKPPSAAAGQIGQAVSGRIRADQAVAALNQKQAIAARNMLKAADVPVSGLGKSRSLEAYQKSIIDGMTNAGKESIAGLAQGLKNGQSAIGQAAKTVGDEGVRAIKDTLGIASPSRVFKDIGRFSVGGLEIGFLNGLKDFKTKAVEGIKSIVKSLQQEARVGMIAVGGLLSPVARPGAAATRTIPGVPSPRDVVSNQDPGRSNNRILSSLSLLTGDPKLYRSRMANLGANRLPSSLLGSAATQMNLEEIAPSFKQARLGGAKTGVANIIDEAFFGRGTLPKAESALNGLSNTIERLASAARAAAPSGILQSASGNPRFRAFGGVPSGQSMGIFPPTAQPAAYPPSGGFLEFSRRATAISAGLPGNVFGGRGGGGVPPSGGGGGGFTSDGGLGGRQGPATFIGTGSQMEKFKTVLDVATASTQNFRASQIPLIGGIKNLAGEFGEATKQVLLYGTAYKGLAFLTSLPGQILNAAKSQQQFNNGLKVATQDTGTFAKELLYVDNVQRAFGLNLETTRTGFTRLYASMAPTGFDSGSIEKLFTGISAATASLQLTPDKAERVIYAFGQMASKGQIMSEELKGQLGDVLPGALAIFSKAAGMSVKEFSKAMEDGEFVGNRFREVFAKVSDELMNRFGSGAAAAGKSLQGLINTVGGDFQRTLESFAPLANVAAQATLGPLAGMLKEVSMAAQIAMGEQDRVRKQLEAAQADVSILKTGGAGAKEIQAAEQNVAALASKYEVLNEAAKDPAIAQQVKNIEAFVTEVQKAATFTMNLAGIIGSVLNPFLSILGGNFTSVAGNLALLILAFNAMKLAALLSTGILTTMNAAVAAGGSISLIAAAKNTVLAGVFRLLGIQITGAQIATITFGAALKGLLISTGIGALVVLLGSLAASALSVGDAFSTAAAKTKQSMDEMKNAVSTGNVALAKSQLSTATLSRNNIEEQVKFLEEMKALGEKQGGRGRPFLRTSLARRMALQNAGFDLKEKQEPDLNDLLGQVPSLRADALNLEQRGIVSVRLAQTKATQLGLDKPTPGVNTPEDTSTAEQKAADKARQDAEKRLQQQQQRAIELAGHESDLQKIAFDRDIQLDDSAFEHKKSLIDALNDYELSGLNDMQARQEKVVQDLKKIQLDAVDTVRKATQKAQEAQLNVVTAQRTAAAAGTGAPLAPALPPPSGAGVRRLSGSISGRLDASGQNGADMPVGSNNAIQSYHNGLVKAIGTAGNNGNYIVIDFIDDLGNRLEATYSHVAAGVRQGQSVVGGQTIGRFDASGRTTGPHNSVDINSLGNNGSFQRNQETSAARRSADLLVTGRVQGSVGSSAAGPSASGASFRMETKQQTEGFDLIEEKAKKSVAIELQRIETQRAIELAYVKTASVIKANIDAIFPVEQQKLDLRLQQMRQSLLMQGMPQEYIDYEMNRATAMEESAIATKNMEASLANAKTKLAVYNDEVKKGVKLTITEQTETRILKQDIEAYEAGLASLTEKQKAYNIVALESAIASIKNADALKAQQDAISLIDGNVESATGSYKNFIKEVARGGDAKEALKKFQESITDQVLTVFLDYSFKPVEEFFKNSLKNMFGLPDAEKAKQDQLAKMEAQLVEQKAILVQAEKIATNTTPGAAAGTTQSPVAGSAFTPGGTLPPIAAGFDAASVFGNPEALTGAFGGVQTSISESMNGIVSSFENGASSLGNALPAWETALATNIPDALKTATKATPTFQESLGKVTAGIGIAAGAIMGIAAGISQIKEGGTSNVLGGIGSVLMSLGGAVGGFAGFLKGANGGVAGGGWKPFPVTAFANGGMVNGPTLGLVGEGKYNEAIVPLPDGRSIPVQMKGGGGGLREAMSGSNGRASGSPILNMSFQSTNINGVEYVSRDQLEAAMAQTRKQASRDGANRGMSMTLDKLQQSPSTRSRLGMGGR